MAWINEIYDTLYADNTVCVACISYGKDSLAMLRAIKHLGLPLHRIVHTEVWATQDIPADLPPMVEFKKHADKIIKELYGIEVEHICATKPCTSSQSVNVERERERERERATKTSSTAHLTREIILETSKDSLVKSESGVNTLNTTVKLTYEDIFYRRYKEGRKEGRKAHQACTDLRHTTTSIAEGNSRIYGFPMRKGNWCQSQLKPPVRISHLNRERTMVSATQTLFQTPQE